MFELVFLSGARAGVVVPVTGTMVAGRDAECALEIPDPRVSRAHARVDWDGVRCNLLDSGSSNGTFLNEKPVREAVLEDGDIVRMGATRLQVRDRRHASGPVWDRPSSVFGIRGDGEPELAHTVPMAKLEKQTGRADAAQLRQRLASMIQVSELLASARSLDDLFEPVLDTLFHLFPQTDRAFLMLGDRAEDLEPRAMRQRTGGVTQELVVSRSICRAALESRSAIVYSEGGDTPIDPSHSMIDLRISSAIAVPLMIGEEILGLVVLDSRNPSRAYSQRELELAGAACHQIAVAIKNARLLAEVEQQTTTRNNLMRFLPHAMADQVLAGEVDAGLGGRRYRGTVLFSDLIGFTARAERMAPDELVTFMNRYFSVVLPCVERERGSVDKFMGDAIMAVWGIPIEDTNATRQAVSAGLAMQIKLAAFNSELTQPFHMGVGISTGEVVAGNIGTENRHEYTVLGDTVNTAQRIGAHSCLEQVLVTQASWAELEGRAFGVRMPLLSVKNKTERLQTFSVRGLKIGEEIQLFVPITFGAYRGWLIRRLEDRSFVLLHDPIALEELRISTVELPDRKLGKPTLVAMLAPESGDGALRRSHIKLEDPTLGGLLGDEVFSCLRAWAEMDRTETSQARQGSPDYA